MLKFVRILIFFLLFYPSLDLAKTLDLLIFVDKEETNINTLNKAITHTMGFAISQEAGPIFVYRKHLLHNLINDSLKIAKLLADQNSDIYQAIKEIGTIKELINRYKLANPEVNQEIIKNAFIKWRPPYFYELMHYLCMQKFKDQWLVFENKIDDYYLLIPKKSFDAQKELQIRQEEFESRKLDLLAAIGFDAQNLEQITFQDLSELAYPVKTGLAELTSDTIDKLMVPAKEQDSWCIYWSGHGLEAERVGGFSIGEAKKFLNLLQYKNVGFLCILSCYLGGINRQDLERYLNDLEKKQRLYDIMPSSNKKIGYPFIIAIASITGIQVSINFRSSFEESIFSKNFAKLTSPDFTNLSTFPILAPSRFDKFFYYCNEYESTVKRVDKIPLKGRRQVDSKQALINMLKQVTTYDVIGKQVEEMTANPYIRFPGYDTTFTPVEVDTKVKILGYVEAKRNELEYRQKKGKVYIIKDKELLVVYPLSLGFAIKFENSIPAISVIAPGQSKHYFQSIDGSSFTLDEFMKQAFLVLQYGREDKYFLINKLTCRNYKDSGIKEFPSDAVIELRDLYFKIISTGLIDRKAEGNFIIKTMQNGEIIEQLYEFNFSDQYPPFVRTITAEPIVEEPTAEYSEERIAELIGIMMKGAPETMRPFIEKMVREPKQTKYSQYRKNVEQLKEEISKTEYIAE